MEKPIAYFSDDGRSWRCDGCGSYGSVARAANGHRFAARHIATHIEECTPAAGAAAADQAVIRPGDTLLIRLESTAPLVQQQTVADRLRDRLPGVNVLVIAADGAHVYRPDTPVREAQPL